MGNATADDWQRLCDQFNSLAARESESGKGTGYHGHRSLLLDCSYTDASSTSPVGTFDNGKWSLRYGAGADFAREFRVIAIEAGKALGATGDVALNYWYHRLCLYLQGEKEIRHFSQGFVQIPDVCRRSASFCGCLKEETLTLEPAERQEPATAAKTGKTAQDVKSTAKLSDRELRIWQIIQQGGPQLRGLQYCRELDNAKVAPLRVACGKTARENTDPPIKQGNPGVTAFRMRNPKFDARRNSLGSQDSPASKSIHLKEPA